MRLICPNCDAQYEVDASLIPDSGRDVQCSDCGHVWFQAPEAHADEIGVDEIGADEIGLDATADDIAAVIGPAATAAPAAVPTPAPAPSPAPASRASAAKPAPTPVPAASDPVASDPAEDSPWPTTPPHGPDEEDPQVLRRHALDESLLAVLREEAEREARARADETARAAGRGIEMQPDLGLDEPGSGPRLRIRPRTTPRPADPGDEDPADATPGAALPVPGKASGPVSGPAPAPGTRAARRELLPDIERINSTLDASNAARQGTAAVLTAELPERQRSGFRRGFVIAVVIGVLGWTAYAQSDRLSEAVPQARPMIEGYVDIVDRARAGLDGLVQGLLETLNS